jgi:hypothetical protein
VTQITNAPEPRRNNSVDVCPNLLITTFAAFAPLLPLRAGKLSESAPPPKAPTVVEIVDRSAPLTLGVTLVPAVQQLQSYPVPQTKIQVFAENRSAPVNLGFHLPPSILQLLSYPEPQTKSQVWAENHSVPRTLSVPSVPNIQQLVSYLQPKYEVVADNRSAPLTLGLKAPPAVRQQTESAPITKYQLSAPISKYYIYQSNVAAPPGMQWFASAPQGAQPNQAENRSAPAALQYSPPTFPNVQRLTESAPVTKFQLSAPIIKNWVYGVQSVGLPNIQQLTQSAPQMSTELMGFMSVGALGTPLAPLITVDTSQFQPKYNVQVDVPPIPQTIKQIITGVAPFKPVDTSQLQTKYEVRADQFPQPYVLRIVPLPPGRFHDASQLQAKYDVGVIAPHPTPSPLGLVSTPSVQQLSASAPITKYQTQVDYLPNLSNSTLFPKVLIPLPLGMHADFCEYQAKYQVQVDVYQNVIIYYNAPSPSGVNWIVVRHA